MTGIEILYLEDDALIEQGVDNYAERPMWKVLAVKRGSLEHPTIISPNPIRKARHLTFTTHGKDVYFLIAEVYAFGTEGETIQY